MIKATYHQSPYRSKVKGPESGTSSRCNHLFAGLLSACPEIGMKADLGAEDHLIPPQGAEDQA